MTIRKEQFLVDSKVERVAVLVDWKEYQRLRNDEEELDAIRAYDEAKSRNETPIPFEQAIAEIRRKRK